MAEANHQHQPDPKLEENRNALFAYLARVLNVSESDLRGRTKSHPPAHTVEEWYPFASTSFPDGKLCKNLFLKDKKKGTIWLAVARADTEVQMNSLTKHLGFSSGTLRFASEDILYDTLGVRQGSVTPLGLFNDKDSHKVRGVLIDARMIEDPNYKLLFHPLSNDFTTEITATELETFLKACGHSVNFFDFANMKSVKSFEQSESIK